MTLPLNSNIEYHQDFIERDEADHLYKYLFDECHIYHCRILLPSGGQMNKSDFGKLSFVDKELHEKNTFPEEIWGKNRPWSQEMLLLKNRVESLTNRIFELCVCIYYPNGRSGVGYHSDPSGFGDNSIIPSISLGEERLFQLREKKTQDVFRSHLGTVVCC